MIILKSLVAQGELPSRDNKIQLLASIPGSRTRAHRSRRRKDEASDAALGASPAACLLGNPQARKEAAY